MIWLPTVIGSVTSATNGSPLLATAVLKPVSSRRCTSVPCRSSRDCARAGIAEAAKIKPQRKAIHLQMQRCVSWDPPFFFPAGSKWSPHPVAQAAGAAVGGLRLVT